MKTITRRDALLTAGAMTIAPPAARARAVDEDTAILREALTALHPGLRRYLSRDALDPLFDRFDDEIRQANDVGDRFLALSRVTAAIRCGHTHPNPSNQADGVTDALLSGGVILPIEALWTHDGLVCTRDLSDEGMFPPGTVIVSINGVDTATLLERLLPLTRADGGNDAKRRSLLSPQGRSRFETLDLLLPRILRLSGAAEFELDSGVRRTARLLHPSERAAARRLAPSGLPWTFEANDDGIAVLTMPTWAVYDSGEGWENWLQDRLAHLKEARGLVVDLRGNEGGLDCGAPILARLTDRAVEPWAPQTRLRYRRVPETLKPYLETYDRSLYDWQDRVTGPDAEGWYTRSLETEVASTTTGPRFGGPVAVLCDAANSSATFNFALAFRTLGLGPIIGQTTGGNLRGINGGAYFFLRLPGCGLEVDVPLIAGFAPEGTPDRGLEPDIAVPIRRDDLVAGRDATMDVARRAILEARS